MLLRRKRSELKKRSSRSSSTAHPSLIRSNSHRLHTSFVRKPSLRYQHRHHYHHYPYHRSHHHHPQLAGYSLEVQLLLSLLDPALSATMPSFYSVVPVHGKKHGFGHVTFSHPYEDFVFATSWNHDVPSGSGFLFNQRTNQVIAHVVNPTTVELLSQAALYTPINDLFTEIGFDVDNQVSAGYGMKTEIDFETETEIDTEGVAESLAEGYFREEFHESPANPSVIQEGAITLQLVDDLPVWDILDNHDGSRWEGVTWRGRSCGLGVFYNDQNMLLYRGLSIDNVWEGYGTLYHEMNLKSGPLVSIQGMWSHGSPLGWSKAYDRRGGDMGEGLWLRSQMARSQELTVLSDLDFTRAHCFLRELTIANNMLNTLSALNLDNFRYLELFEVGRHSLRKCSSLVIPHLSQLRRIHIGEYSFTSYDTALDLLLSESSRILSRRKMAELTDLPSLEEITVGKGSFSDFMALTIRNAPSLKTIVLGDEQEVSCNFFYTEKLSLHRMFVDWIG